MRTAKRITTACLTAIMIFQALAPSTEVFAQELDAVMEASVSAARAAGKTARSVQDAVATALQDADQATSDDTAATPGADTGTTEDGNGSTNAGESQDSTTDGAGGGAASTEGDAFQDDATADDGTTDEEQMNDADADAAAQANTTYEYSTVDKLKDAIGDANVTVEGDKVTKVTIGTSEDLIKLSNVDPAIYQDAALTKGGATGSGLNLCNTVTAADGKALSFLGLGAQNTPFKGSFDLGTSPIVLNRPLFNNVELSTDMTLALTWEGTTSDPVVATTINGGHHKLAVDITAATLSSPLLGSVSGELRLDVNYAAKGNETLAINIQSKTDNAGLLVNTLADAASLSVEKLALPGTYSGDPTIQTTKDGTSAGGLIGVCGNGATVAINGNIDLSAFSVKGRAASGGLIGKAAHLTLAIAADVTIKPARGVGDEGSACSGGIIGDVSFARGFTVKPNMFDLGDLVTLGASQRAGALFGVADISTGDIVVQGGTYKSKLASGKGGGVSGSYGGLVGKVFAMATGVDGALRAFVVEKDADKKTCSIAFDLASELSDAGGVVGYVGDSANPNSQPVAVVLNGVTVACKGDASARTDTGKFGGAVGVVDTRNALDVRDFTLTSDKAIGGAVKNRAAGIAGSAWNAVIKFSGITDLSGASFAENATTGQLVYENNNALIFAVGNGSNGNMTDEGATGWTFRRSGKASKTDDIATYGEVIRLGDSFITLDPSTHKLTLPASLTQTNGAYALTTAEDFAKLAITWQTNGYYSMVNGVTENNLNGLQSSTITVNDTIDLTGTGLTGFTQDRADGSQVFSGTLNGGGTINLAVGEAYGKRGEDVLDDNNTSSGNGKIYRHGRPGLFAAINGATVSNVTIAGSMKFDNGVGIDAGSLAGTVAGGLTLSGATCKTNIACDDTFANDANIGGIAGSVSAASTVTFKGNSKAQATITAAKTLNGNIRIGGAVGYVGDCASTFNVEGLEISGKIETGDCASNKIAQVGGFIGCIAQSTYNAGEIVGSADKYVNISGLSFSSFKMNVRRNGDALKGTGGLLGYSWGNTTVTIGNTAENNSDSAYALRTSNDTKVTANDSTEVGGLVYAASGHWIINNYAIDLSGTTIHADVAQTLGVLVCRGCKVDNKTTYGVESYIGLYLEDRAYWETAYRVPSGEGSIVAPGVTSFDEWVGSGVKPNKGSKLMDADWNTVVSLHTQNDKLNMDGDATKDNSYQNRSTFGQGHKTNGNTRYFYNLDRAYDRCKGGFSGGQINTADKLLLWSAFCYAPAGIRSTIVPDGTTGLDGSITITGTIDLAGYSYYPTQPIGEVTVNNAAITFYYSKIKAEQNDNKLNSDATQHENMHCGLFRTVENGDLTVNSVTLGGTVGPVINDAKSSDDAIGAGGSSSGALVCRYVYGSIGSNGTTIRKISIDGLTLNNLIVDGANSATDANAYMPLLINEMQKYVSLNAKNIKTTGYTSGTKAATSLFGKLGVGSEADQVTAKFERISLSSQNSNTIFTHASLLESFGYKSTGTGSADYTFTKADANAGMVTYGSEIDAKGKEYSGKQLWYYDESTYDTPNGLVKAGDKAANVDAPVFGDFLPYVYKGKADEPGVQYHEIRVNQRIPKLVTGCGTYGDPYSVTNAAEMNAIANYINNMTALDGWEVTIVADQGRLCTRRSSDHSTNNEVTYVYKQANGTDNKWEKKTGDASTDSTPTLSDETMHRYMQGAYYSIEPAEGNTITLDGASFGGFGNRANPFRGVIVGNLGSDHKNATIKIENNEGSLRGLIPYSYGSVVRSLNINYVNAQATITYSAKDSDGDPTAFFGGVIGCILGGDNIIDGTVVNGTTADNPTTGFTVAGGGTKPHLVPIGGYVGAIAGGGVIFRHMSGTSWRAGTSVKFQGLGAGNFQLYDNPYVGRVIDGYAFSEGCHVENGDANYKINELNVNDTGCVTTVDTYKKYSWNVSRQNNNAPQTTVKDSQGLLVLSAIINSGAGAGAAHTDVTEGGKGTYRGSHAYEGSSVHGDIPSTGYKFGNERYGKVRNASYTAVGKPADVAAGDFEISINDDLKAPGNQAYQGALDGRDGDDINSPYLVKKYATDWRTGYVCAMGVCGMDLKFEQGVTYDMRDYGSGFLGLSGRHYSNACATDKKVNDKDFITPGIATVNGNGATIKVSNNTREYVDDDYCVAGVGGLFSTIKFYSSAFNKGSIEANGNANVNNLNFNDCNISLAYVSLSGKEQSKSTSNTKSGWVGAGCLAGSTANQGGSGGVTYGVFKKVVISSSTVAGGCMAGGLIGSAGLMARSTDGANGSIVNYGGTSSPVQLYDCSYSGIAVSARSNAGGFVGYINSGTCGMWVSKDKTVADSSTIYVVEKAGDSQDTGSTAGGIFGLTGGTLVVNTGQGENASQVATIKDVSLVVNHKALGVGGIAGRTVTRASNINRVKVTSTNQASEEAPTYFGSLQAVANTANAYAISTGGIIGSTSNNVTLSSCTVEKLRMGVTEHAGGLVGATSNGNTLSANNITVDGAQFDGARCGGILGNCQGQGATNVVVTNTTVQNCSFGTLNSTWNHSDGNLRNHSGGIVGAASGTIKIANVLIRENDFKQPGGQGFLLGDTAQYAADFKGLYAAGVDIILKDRSDNSATQKPIKYFNDSAVADVNKKSYIAFGDYNDTLTNDTHAESETSKTLYGADAADSTTAAVSPYVTTRPVSKLAVRASDNDATDRYLFGDGVNVSGASTIQDEAVKNVTGRYTYNNIGGIDKDGAYQNTSSYLASSAGKFNANNDTDATKSNANPDVLVLSGNDSDTVKDYLNIVTNGGYSDALRLNADGSHVSATVDVFQLKNGVFVKQTNVTDRALDVKGSGSSLSISANSNWDNGKGRFNLLTVTFTEAGQSYKVMVPIIVKRVLEINFTATYSEGSNFNSGDYSTKYDKHVLISSGETMTGYLTWTYNKAYAQETEYGWNTHLASGGDMRPLNKRIEFGGKKGALPVGAQLTLVDMAHNNKEYHYTVPEGGSCASVALTDFEDSTGNHYTEQWLSETMGATATEADDGTWVKLTNKEKGEKTEAELAGIAGAKIGNDYYRVKTDTDKKPFYSLTVPKKKVGEQPKSESFYLVVRTPKGSASVNGYTGTSVKTSVNTHLNYTLRNKDETKDSHENTASTYSVATNFQHNLVDNKSGTNQMAVRGTTYRLDMDVNDTVTFGEQEYTTTDALYYQLDSSLVNYQGSSAAGAHGYPTGTQGTYSFYVMVENSYYTWDGSKWTDAGTTETPAIAAKDWSATGGDMSLVLADASGKAIDLSGIREIAKSHGSKFTITMNATLTMTEPACQAGIVASQKSGADRYTKPNYRAYLSTHADTLSTSSNSDYSDGKAGYYRMDVGSSTIALEASKKSQLGINIDDLKSADGEIALVGTYDFSKVTGADAMISNATEVTYTLTLQQRQDDGSYGDVKGIANYLSVLGSDHLGAGEVSPDGNSYVFTDSKPSGTFATRDGNSLAFKHAFRVKVNTNVEKTGQTYANYRLVLTAHMSGGGVNDTPVNVSNLDGYANSDYVTYTLARINTEGIPHEAKTN
ncbi:beta strand repeat-containing protein [Collinsella aerofaciens]|uniref:Uncharacterized protein n=1 Tax=Collinsella aerofaciens TaxID=74426 RepID=A0A5K1IZA2_9ACTN|nr:hypothetical protein [Collinsella aerofaciens]VWL94961.1 Uncharacterised protein [Collinsella aerofaciens]